MPLDPREPYNPDQRACASSPSRDRCPGGPIRCSCSSRGAASLDPRHDALVRQIAQAAVAPDAPPTITGSSTPSTSRTLPGEGETQTSCAPSRATRYRYRSCAVRASSVAGARWRDRRRRRRPAVSATPCYGTRLACGLPPRCPQKAPPTRRPSARHSRARIMSSSCRRWGRAPTRRSIAPQMDEIARETRLRRAAIDI